MAAPWNRPQGTENTHTGFHPTHSDLIRLECDPCMAFQFPPASPTPVLRNCSYRLHWDKPKYSLVGEQSAVIFGHTAVPGEETPLLSSKDTLRDQQLEAVRRAPTSLGRYAWTRGSDVGAQAGCH